MEDAIKKAKLDTLVKVGEWLDNLEGGEDLQPYIDALKRGEMPK